MMKINLIIPECFLRKKHTDSSSGSDANADVAGGSLSQASSRPVRPGPRRYASALKAISTTSLFDVGFCSGDRLGVRLSGQTGSLEGPCWLVVGFAFCKL